MITANQPGAKPFSIPQTVPNPATQPWPEPKEAPPRRESVPEPEKVPEKVTSRALVARDFFDLIAKLC